MGEPQKQPIQPYYLIDLLTNSPEMLKQLKRENAVYNLLHYNSNAVTFGDYSHDLKNVGPHHRVLIIDQHADNKPSPYASGLKFEIEKNGGQAFLFPDPDPKKPLIIMEGSSFYDEAIKWLHETSDSMFGKKAEAH